MGWAVVKRCRKKRTVESGGKKPQVEKGGTYSEIERLGRNVTRWGGMREEVDIPQGRVITFKCSSAPPSSPLLLSSPSPSSPTGLQEEV